MVKVGLNSSSPSETFMADLLQDVDAARPAQLRASADTSTSNWTRLRFHPGTASETRQAETNGLSQRSHSQASASPCTKSRQMSELGPSLADIQRQIFRKPVQPRPPSRTLERLPAGSNIPEPSLQPVSQNVSSGDAFQYLQKLAAPASSSCCSKPTKQRTIAQTGLHAQRFSQPSSKDSVLLTVHDDDEWTADLDDAAMTAAVNPLAVKDEHDSSARFDDAPSIDLSASWSMQPAQCGNSGLIKRASRTQSRLWAERAGQHQV